MDDGAARMLARALAYPDFADPLTHLLDCETAHPRDAAIQQGLGQCDVHLGDFERAACALQAALALEDDAWTRAEAACHLARIARVCTRTGRLADARYFVERARAIEPNDAIANTLRT